MKPSVQILIAIALFVVGAFVGWHVRPECPAAVPIAGTVPAVEVAEGMTETKPDTVYVPIPVPGPERIKYVPATQTVSPEVVPIETIEPGPARDAAIETALIDWNTKRNYKGALFDGPRTGSLVYDFDVQFNRVGELRYQFTPPPIPTPKTTRWGIGFQAGYGASMQQGRVVGYPSIGVGVSYNFIRW
jgi:hypothetical protein